MHLLSGAKISKPKSIGGLGIPSMRQSNAATLAKLGWRMLQEPESLWSRVLRGKYCHSRADIDVFQSVPRSSNTWKGIIHGSRILSKGLRMAIGNGCSTLFWFHSWLLEAPLVDSAIQIAPEEMQGMTVAECWNEGNWNWDLVTPYLPNSVLLKLLSVRISDQEDAPDKIFWNHTSFGDFTSKSAIRLLHEPDTSNDDPIWRHIWKIPVQQRARHFVYLLVKNCLMCNANRFRRHIAPNSECPCCFREETELHLLRDCSIIKEVWKALFGNNFSPSFFTTNDLHDWILVNIKTKNDYCTLFVYILWFTWKCRNKLVFDKVDEVSRLSVIVCTNVDAFKVALKVDVKIFNSPLTKDLPRIETTCWNRPTENWIKLNTDGISKGNPGLAGGGGLFRDHTGTVMKVFCFFCGESTSLTAELFAIMYGLQLGIKLGIVRLIVETDSFVATQLLQAETIITHRDYHLIDSCRRLIKDNSWEVQVCFVRRDLNKAADLLANHSLTTLVPFTDFDVVHDFLSRVLLDDIVAPLEHELTV